MSEFVHSHDDKQRVSIDVDFGRLRQIINYIDESILLLKSEREKLVKQFDALLTKDEDIDRYWGSGS